MGSELISNVYFATTNEEPKMWIRSDNTKGAPDPNRTEELTAINHHTPDERDQWLSNMNKAAILTGVVAAFAYYALVKYMYVFGGEL